MLRRLLAALRPAGTREDPGVLPPLAGLEEMVAAGRLDEAERLARRRLAASPSDIDGLSALAGVLAGRRDLHQASALAERIGAMPAARADHLVAAAEILRRAGREGAALALAEEACRREPSSAIAWIQRATLLETLARFGEAYDAYRAAIVLDPSNRDVHSTLLFMLYSSGLLPPEAIADEHRAWAARHADPLTGAAPSHAIPRDPERRLRIGYVSADLRHHAVAYFIEPVLRAHDRGAFEVHCYSSWPRPDDRTTALRVLSDAWHDISAMDDTAADALIRADGIDILVDLSGHTRGNRLPLFARKPAPVQISWLGYLGTTGMKAMDYCITDAFADPPGGSDRHYTEKLLRLPVPQWCYAPPPDAPAVTARGGEVVFGSLAGYSRLNADTFRAWGTILNGVPGSRLRVFGVRPGDQTDRLFEAAETARVDLARLELVAQREHADYLRALQDLDVVLGSFPYTGATTTCEALWMGLPLVCIAGAMRPSRSSASILHGVGLPELVADAWPEYCAIATRLGNDPGLRARLRAEMRGRMARSPVTDAARFTRLLEDAYRSAWVRA